jgi:alpha-mannosidase
MTRTLHLIGNAHIDAVWLWPWEEGFAEVKATFRSALDRMTEYPEFVFTCSSAAYYDWIEHNEPAMFDEIRQRVNEGRWRITGGWWVEPDCNIPSGESFVRQALIGQHYFASRFGRIARVGYNPDAFGHAGSLPQILRLARLTGYTFLRPEPHEREMATNLFWWESPDGSRVLAFRINFGYTMWGDLEEHIRRHMDRFVDGTDALMCFYGVGNHGGGPTRANLDTIRALDGADDVAVLRHSWPGAFFEAVADASDLPVVRDELQHHAVGCYAAVSGIKRWNRQAEELLGFAERWASIAFRERLQPYPGRVVERVAPAAPQPVPRHPGRHEHRAGLRGRAIADRRVDGRRRSGAHERGAGGQLGGRHARAGGRAADRRGEPARVADAPPGGGRGGTARRGRPPGRRRGARRAVPGGAPAGDVEGAAPHRLPCRPSVARVPPIPPDRGR